MTIRSQSGMVTLNYKVALVKFNYLRQILHKKGSLGGFVLPQTFFTIPNAHFES